VERGCKTVRNGSGNPGELVSEGIIRKHVLSSAHKGRREQTPLASPSPFSGSGIGGEGQGGFALLPKLDELEAWRREFLNINAIIVREETAAAYDNAIDRLLDRFRN
jgi:hypothetical protein